MGKVKRVSLPYAPGGTVYWTTYTFDGLGRVLTVAQPNGAGTTTYLYQGNTVRVTSPSGKWKQHEMNALGQLVKVTEPRPGGGTYETSYTYNITGKLVGVSMPRDGVTQTRTFQYDTQTYSLLQSATNPENGTVNYVYNADRSLQSKTDAKGIKTEFSYDSYKRVLQVRKLTGNINSGGALVEDRCQRVDYIYDEGPGGAGRLTRIRWGWNLNGQGAEVPCVGPAALASKIGFEEKFEYNAAGRILSKRLVYYRVVGSVLRSADLKLDWTYNTDGQPTSVTYPFQQQLNSSGEGRPVVNVSYDGMARLSGLTWRGLPWASTDPLPPAQTIASSAVYNARNALTSLNIDGVTETRQYNLLGQLTRITQLGQIDIEYRFSATANDGKITSQRNWISGEEVSYLYDELERLSSATTTGPEWGLSWGYDGFGNRLSQSVTKGSGPTSMTPTNAATNRLTGAGYSYDANGNMTGMPQLNSTMTYDHSNRMVEVTNSNGGEAYIYAPDNRRVWRSQGVDPGQGNAEQVMLYSPGGQLMGVYRVAVGTFPSGATVITKVQENVYWGWRPIYSPGTGRRVTDRLSSVGNGSTYYPYGEYKASGSTSGGQDTVQFATYRRDAKTGLDYADQRYYAAGLGRFITPDPYAASGGAMEPSSWNRYPYVTGDPVNHTDPLGLFNCKTCVNDPEQKPGTPSNGDPLVPVDGSPDVDSRREDEVDEESPGTSYTEAQNRIFKALEQFTKDHFLSNSTCKKVLESLAEKAGHGATAESLAQSIAMVASRIITNGLIYNGLTSTTALSTASFLDSSAQGARTVGEWFDADPNRRALSQYDGDAIFVNEPYFTGAFGVYSSGGSASLNSNGMGALFHEILHKQTVGGGFDHVAMSNALRAAGISPGQVPYPQSYNTAGFGIACFK
jgi:RHS repeat-associated protein